MVRLVVPTSTGASSCTWEVEVPSGRFSFAVCGPGDWAVKPTKTSHESPGASVRPAHPFRDRLNCEAPDPLSEIVPTCIDFVLRFLRYTGTGVALAPCVLAGQLIDIELMISPAGRGWPIWISPNSAGARPSQCCSYSRSSCVITPFETASRRTSNAPATALQPRPSPVMSRPG